MTLNQHQFLWLATVFEGGLVLIAYLLGTWLSIDPLEHLKPDLNALVLGLMGTLPLYGLFILSHRLDIAQDIRRFLVDKLGGLLAGCSGIGLLYLGLLAGVTEEILFRGLLQPWLEQGLGLARRADFQQHDFCPAALDHPALRTAGRALWGLSGFDARYRPGA